jgi:hypothetical protein
MWRVGTGRGKKGALVCSSKMKAGVIFGREEMLLILYASDREAGYMT